MQRITCMIACKSKQPCGEKKLIYNTSDDKNEQICEIKYLLRRLFSAHIIEGEYFTNIICDGEEYTIDTFCRHIEILTPLYNTYIVHTTLTAESSMCQRIYPNR